MKIWMRGYLLQNAMSIVDMRKKNKPKSSGRSGGGGGANQGVENLMTKRPEEKLHTHGPPIGKKDARHQQVNRKGLTDRELY